MIRNRLVTAGMLAVALALSASASEASREGSASVPALSITEFRLIDANSGPAGITAGPDRNLWFTEAHGSRIGRVTPAGKVDDWSSGSGISKNNYPLGISAGPDGNLWYASFTGPTLRIGRMSPSSLTATEFTLGLTARPLWITAGPDGNLWFTEPDSGQVGRITPAGAVTEFSTGISPGSGPEGITLGSDGNLWFTEITGNRIGRITPTGVVTEFSAGITPGSEPYRITAGPDGNLWFTEEASDRIGRITPSGVVTEFSAGITPGSLLDGITLGPDGNLWFTESSGNRIGRITPSGAVTEFSAGITPGSAPDGITAGPDYNIWFTEFAGNRIGRLILAPVVSTGGASSVGPGSGHLAGTVTPFGAQTSYLFQYGRTKTYGKTTMTQTLPPAGKPIGVSVRIRGLRPHTRYHYRLAATNPSGTIVGTDRTFTTRRRNRH